MKTWKRLRVGVGVGAGVAALLTCASVVWARPEFPGRLDQSCAGAGRLPANPAELARQSATLGDCALCHNFDLASGSSPGGGNVNSNGRSYLGGNLDPFCTLAPMNRPPVLDPVGNQTVAIGELLEVLLSAMDPDGDPLTFSADPAPAGSTLTERAPGLAAFQWTPMAGEDGFYPITFGVSDGALSDSESVTIAAGDVNAPPSFGPIPDQIVAVGDTLVLRIEGTDPEGTALTYMASGLPGDAMLTMLADGAAELFWAPTAVASFDVTVSATDAGTPPASAEASFALAAVDPATGLRIDRAKWKRGKLKVRGSGATPRAIVSVLDADSGAELGSRAARRSGSFRVVARPFMAPCSVQAASGLEVSVPLPVEGAPEDCGQAVLTRVRRAQWDCEHLELEVRGDRAPAGASVEVHDPAATPTLVAEGRADERGRFRIRATLATGPTEVELRFAAGAEDVVVGPVPVEQDHCGAGGSDDEDSDGVSSGGDDGSDDAVDDASDDGSDDGDDDQEEDGED